MTVCQGSLKPFGQPIKNGFGFVAGLISIRTEHFGLNSCTDLVRASRTVDLQQLGFKNMWFGEVGGERHLQGRRAEHRRNPLEARNSLKSKSGKRPAEAHKKKECVILGGGEAEQCNFCNPPLAPGCIPAFNCKCLVIFWCFN